MGINATDGSYLTTLFGTTYFHVDMLAVYAPLLREHLLTRVKLPIPILVP